ncbi:carboxypeptidase regulatory-like domain-containing protein [Mucilaginibacter flavidus]|uniref:carboxypeptidase regulatory-like domain-containing protein n=1 Tax=Mucilaginibacter flavidus TaxID=2949309 RepID=UPI002092664C|nr:carboxypeptidase regulatory-like domain-containing protein [Mucilaginibacter flavidus]MCO5945875.1 carboxypeptidase regulatory-like domain-containing protein [Mucilaginibacter flavidus]
MAKTLLLLFFLLPAVIFGQVTVTGKVVNHADGKPVANATVFLNNTTTGTKTTATGIFSLKNAKAGKYDLVVSAPGFDAYKQTINAENGNQNIAAISLSAKVKKVTTLTEAEKNNYGRYLGLFKDEFLGTSALAKESKITNPEVLDLKYDEKTSTLTASADGLLLITNAALGYNIKYLLKDFTLNNGEEKTSVFSGCAFFEKIKGTAKQEQEWQNRREEAYEGSLPHFLRSVIADNLDQQGFKAQRLPSNAERPADSVINAKLKKFIALSSDKASRDSLNYWVKKKNLPKTPGGLLPTPLAKTYLITGADNSALYTLSGKSGEIYVAYSKYHAFANIPLNKLAAYDNTGNTLLHFNGPAVFFDKNGIITNSESITMEGAWLRKRLADNLPTDYQPQQSEAITPDSLLVKNLNQKITAYTGGHIEKAYLHFDKPYYATGDTIYFKAYVTDGAKHELSTWSEVLNADLINSDNKIARSVKLQLTNGLGWGTFVLADTLSGGNYHIRAYTNWMRNAGNDYFFDQAITIGSASGTKVPEGGSVAAKSKLVPVVALNKSDVQFLPESGNMLAGVKTQIAVKTISPDGFGTEIKGIITDSENKPAGTFATTHLGMGVFEFIPVAGKTYKAGITFADGSSTITELPKVNDNGYQLNIDNANAGIIKINVIGGKQNALDKLTLVGQSGGVVYFSAKNADAGKFSIAVSKKEFPTGVVQFTLFDANGQPLNERLVFVNNNDQLNLNVSTGQTAYAARHKVQVTIQAKNKLNQPAIGNFSVAVTDESKVPIDESNENTILSKLLLTSELKGYIEQPNYYFTNVTDKTGADLDALMLTQGYHRFEWKQVLDNTPHQVTYQPEKALEIAGLVKKGSKPLANQKVTLFAKSATNFFKDTVTDANGRFIFKNLVFGDSTKFVVQAKTAKGQDNVVLTVDTPSTPAILRLLPAWNTAAGGKAGNGFYEIDMSAYIQNSKQFNMEQQKYGINKHPLLLKGVTVKDKKGPDQFEHSQNFNGKGSADQVVTAKDLETLACGRLTECLRAKLNNIVFKNGYMYVRKLSGLDALSGDEFKDPMKVIIDGTMQEASADLLDNVSTGDVESVEVLDNIHSTAIYGAQGSAGLLIITLKQGRKANNYYRYSPGVVTYMPKGFYLAKEFYSPQYDNPQTNQKMADLRSTIYWNPTVVTGQDGKASFEFFNADGKGTYRVVVEGIDVEGNLGRQVYRYKVD